MSLLQDPFYVVKEEVQQSVNGITTLYDRWQELLKSTNTANDEFKWTTNQLRTGIKSIEWDLQDLEETIGIVENNRQKFRLEQAEVDSRKKFISETQYIIKKMKEELNSAQTKGKMDNDQRDSLMKSNKGGHRDPSDRFAGLDDAIRSDNDAFLNNQSQMQDQIMRRQDDDLDAIGAVVTTLGEMGQSIHTELDLQNRMLGDLEAGVDSTSGRLTAVMRRVNKLLESTSDRVQMCIVIVLVLILVGLIIIVFYV